MMRENTGRIRFIFFMLVLLVIAGFIVNICVGSVHISLTELRGAFSDTGDEKIRNIIMNIRLPRTIMTFT
ncbi:MAG: hypothetical protein K6A90_15130, partial [Lachnospiraceae bacterium]|nr:hypothetical protein [Lachnospiraceae bacterium]